MKFLDASILNHQTLDPENTIECYMRPGSDFLLFGSTRFDILLATKKYDLELFAEKGIQFREMWATISVPWFNQGRGK